MAQVHGAACVHGGLACTEHEQQPGAMRRHQQQRRRQRLSNNKHAGCRAKQQHCSSSGMGSLPMAKSRPQALTSACAPRRSFIGVVWVERTVTASMSGPQKGATCCIFASSLLVPTALGGPSSSW